jgi:hypothetical protein
MSISTRLLHPAGPSRRTPGRAGVLLGSAFVAAFGWLLAGAAPVAACSCAQFESMKDYANAESAVFTGTAGLRQDRGVPVEVDQWLWGAGAAPVVWLSAGSFGDSSSCGTNPPPPDSMWIWVTWRDPESGDFGTGLCSPAAQLATDEGKAMLADAVAVFGALTPPVLTPGPTDEIPAATLAPATPRPADPAAEERDRIALMVGGAVVLASVALFGGVALVARRQRPGAGPG